MFRGMAKNSFLTTPAALLLVATFLLCGCGLAQCAALSPFATEDNGYIPKNGSKEDIMQASAKHPDAALLSPAFYKAAAPGDVAKVLQQVNPTQITQRRITDRTPYQGSFPSDFGSSVVKGVALPVFKLETTAIDPMPVALKYSEHPEVIAMLAEAGCPMQGSVRAYLDVWPPNSRTLPVNPEIVAVLLRYEPSPENSSFLLTRLLFKNEELFPPEAVKVFLSMAQNMDMRDDRGFAAFAVESGSLEKLRLLLAAGADPDYHLGHKSPLTLAQEADRQDMVKELFAAGARQNKATKK